LYALSNRSTETFPIALSRFECLKWFQGVLLSAEVRLLKTDRRIFEVFFKTFAIDPARAIYIYDRKVNVEVAASFGMHGILFTDSRSLRKELMRAEFIVG
jgi:2-haloacid dehalogenase